MKAVNTMLMLIVAATSWTASSLAMDREEYVDAVVEILRTHARLLEDLSDGDRFKYSDNLVRHAVALDETFGLLRPMEWHTARSARLHAELNPVGESLDEAMFESLAESSQKSLSQLIRAAHDSMERHDAGGMLKAIDDVKNACNDCHRLLPADSVPDVWGNLQRD